MSDLFSEAEVILKQVDASTLGEIERHALSTALLAYGLGDDDDEIERGTAEMRRVFGDVDVQFDPARARRFAGDHTLPRSRYYSLAEDDFGFDDGTLLREISAYLVGSTYPGLVSFFETGQNTTELLAILAEIPKQNQRSLDLAVPSLLIALRPLISDPVLEEAYGKGNHYVVQIPYVVSVQTIQDVIDLRRPAARVWLVERFSGDFEFEGRRFRFLLEREPLAEFSQLLPSLLDQWLGAGWSTGNLTGYFARDVRANGLVYPSARTNPFVEVEHDAVARSSGWCFVLYAGAPEMETTHTASQASDAWPTTVGYAPQTASGVESFIPVQGAAVEYEQSGSRAGSFWVSGVAEYNTAVYRHAQAVTVLRSIDSDLGARVGSGLSYVALYNPPEEIASVARIILRGLLGATEWSVEKLDELVEAAGSEPLRETLLGAQALVSRAPRSFRAAGGLADALTLS